MFPDLKSLIKNCVITKSRDLTSNLGNGKHSNISNGNISYIYF